MVLLHRMVQRQGLGGLGVGSPVARSGKHSHWLEQPRGWDEPLTGPSTPGTVRVSGQDTLSTAPVQAAVGNGHLCQGIIRGSINQALWGEQETLQQEHQGAFLTKNIGRGCATVPLPPPKGRGIALASGNTPLL